MGRQLGLVGRLSAGAGVAAVLTVPFLLVLLFATSANSALDQADHTVADALNTWASRSSSARTALEVLGYVTAPRTFHVLVLFVAALLWRAGSRSVATWAVTTMAVGGVLGYVLKLLAQRTRPIFDAPVSVAEGYSFPSGHALNSLLGVGVLLLILLPLLGRRGRVLAWSSAVFVVLIIGVDRIGLGVHFVSDVVGGWLLALALLAGTTVAFGVRRWHRPADGLDPAQSQRLARDGEASGTAPGQGGIPALVGEIRQLLKRVLGRAGMLLLLMMSLGLVVLTLDDVLWPLTVEEELVRSLAANRTATWNELTQWMSWLGATGTVEITLVFVVAVFRFVFGRWRESAFVVAAVAVQALVFLLTTQVISRQRPEDGLGFFPGTASFPSGHTGAAVAMYGSVALVLAWRIRRTWMRILVVAVLLVPPVCVAYSRIYRGMHFPSDIAGALINAGLSIAIAAKAVLWASLAPQLREVLDRRVTSDPRPRVTIHRPPVDCPGPGAAA